jgi:NAD(P)H dehydrogenase (quinone)
VTDLYAVQWDAVSDRRNFTTVKDPEYFKQQDEELYATEVGGFSADVKREMERLFWCDALILQFPLWWFSVPAILKGWIDRVFALGSVYGGGRWYDRGVFKGKRAMLSLTTGGPPTMYSPDGLNGDIDMLLYPVNHGVLRFTGFDVLPPFVAWGPARAGDEGRAEYLRQYEARLRSFFETEPTRYPSLDEFDPSTFARK